MLDRSLISVRGHSVEESAIRKFQVGLRGNLIRPGDSDYEIARHVWNRSCDKYPGIIVRCANREDVVRAVDFARSNELLVAVRGGGHSFAGHSTCDGGILIDLTPMKEIRVDADGRIASAQAGVKVGELDSATQAFGLATVMGGCEDVGIAGFTLGGGQGLLTSRYGLGCDNVLSVEVVTASGDRLIANEHDNADLFWGMRGGAGNFGIAITLEYRLHPISTIYGGTVAYPIAQAKQVLRAWRDYIREQPDELTTFLGITRLPEGPVIGIVACYCGDLDRGAEVLRPLDAFGSPLMNSLGRTRYLDFQHSIDVLNPRAVSAWRKSSFAKEFTDDSLDVIAEYAGRAPRNFAVGLFPYRGALVRVASDESAFPIREPGCDILIDSYWQERSEAESSVEWTSSFWNAMRPFTTNAVYVNNLSAEGEERAKAAYGANYDRLVALKNKYDPTNFFRINQNIKPTV